MFFIWFVIFLSGQSLVTVIANHCERFPAPGAIIITHFYIVVRRGSTVAAAVYTDTPSTKKLRKNNLLTMKFKILF